VASRVCIRMKTPVALVVASLLVGSVAAADPTPAKPPSKVVVGKDPLVVELGTAIGPFKLGMPMDQVVAIDASLEPVPGQRYSSQRWIEVGYDVKDRLSWISLHVNEYAPGIVVEGKKLAKPVTLEALRKAVPGCGAPDPKAGGSLAKCKGGTEVGVVGPVNLVVVALRAP
jgi:hypothetical protein